MRSQYQQCLCLGYELHQRSTDYSGNKRKYTVSGLLKSGGIGHFDTKVDLQKWLDDVSDFRRMLIEEGTTTLYDFMNKEK